MRKPSPNDTVVHCFMHRFALYAKVLSPTLLSCLNRVIRIVNFIKISALNTRLFQLFCQDLGADISASLDHTALFMVTRRGVSLNWRGWTSRFLHGEGTQLSERFGERGEIYHKIGQPVGHLWSAKPLKLVISKYHMHCHRVHLAAGNFYLEAGSVDEDRGEQNVRNVQTPDYPWERAHWWICPKNGLSPLTLQDQIEALLLGRDMCLQPFYPFFVDPADVHVGFGRQKNWAI